MLYTLVRTRASVLVLVLLLVPLRIACSRLHQYFHYVSDSCADYETIIEDAYLQVNDIAVEAESLLRDPSRSVSRLELIRLFFAADLLPERRIELSKSKVLMNALESRISKPLTIYERISDLKNKKLEARLYCSDDFLQWFPASGVYYDHDSQKTFRGLSQGKTCSSGNDAFVIIDDGSDSTGAKVGFFTLVLCPTALSVESRNPGKPDSAPSNLDASIVSSYYRTLSVSILRELTRVGKVNTRDHLVSISNGNVKEAKDWEGCTELAASNGTLAVDNAENYAAFGFACFTQDYLRSNRYVVKRKGHARNRRVVKRKSDGDASKCQNYTKIWTSTFTLTITRTLNNAWAQSFVTTSDSSSKRWQQHSESSTSIQPNWYKSKEGYQNSDITTFQLPQVSKDKSYTSTGHSQFWNDARSSITSPSHWQQQNGQSSSTNHKPWQHDNSISSHPMSYNERNQGDHTTWISSNNVQQRDGGSSHATSHSYQPYWNTHSSASMTRQWDDGKGASSSSQYELPTWENSASHVQTSKDWSQTAYHEKVPRSSAFSWSKHDGLTSTQSAANWKPQSGDSPAWENPSSKTLKSHESSWRHKKTSLSWYQDYSSATATWDDWASSTPSWNHASSSPSWEQDHPRNSETWQGQWGNSQSWGHDTSSTSSTSLSWNQGHTSFSSTWVDRKDSTSSSGQGYPNAQTTWQDQKSGSPSWVQWHTSTSTSWKNTQTSTPSWKQDYTNTHSAWHDHGNDGQPWEHRRTSTSILWGNQETSTPSWEQWHSTPPASWKDMKSSTPSWEHGYPGTSTAEHTRQSEISSWGQWRSSTSSSSWVNQRSSTPPWEEGYTTTSTAWKNGQSSVPSWENNESSSPAWEPEHTDSSPTWQARTSSSSRHQGHTSSPTPNSWAWQEHQSSTWKGTPGTYTSKDSSMYNNKHETSPTWNHEVSTSTSTSSTHRSLHRSIRSTTSTNWNEGNGIIAPSSSLQVGNQYPSKGGTYTLTTTTDYGQLKRSGTSTESTTTRTEYYQSGSSPTSRSIFPDTSSTEEYKGSSSYKRISTTSQPEVYWNPSITFDQFGNDTTVVSTSSHGWRSSSTSLGSSYPASGFGVKQSSFPTYQPSIDNNGPSVSVNTREQTQSAHSAPSFYTPLLPVSSSSYSDTKLSEPQDSPIGGSTTEHYMDSLYPSASFDQTLIYSSQYAHPGSASPNTSAAQPYLSTSSGLAFFQPGRGTSKHSSSPFMVTSNSFSLSPSSSSWLAPSVIITNAFFQPPRWSSEVVHDPVPSLSTSFNSPLYSPSASHGQKPFLSSERQTYFPAITSSTESILSLPTTNPSLGQPSSSFTERPWPIPIPSSVHMLSIHRASMGSLVDPPLPFTSASSTKPLSPVSMSSSVHLLQIPAASLDPTMPLPTTSLVPPSIPMRGASLSNQIVSSNPLPKKSPTQLPLQESSSVSMPLPLPTTSSIISPILLSPSSSTSLPAPLATSSSIILPLPLPKSSSSILPLPLPTSSSTILPLPLRTSPSTIPPLPLATSSSILPLPLPSISSIIPPQPLLTVPSSHRLLQLSTSSSTSLLRLPTFSSPRPSLSVPTSPFSTLRLPVPTISSEILPLPSSTISSTAPQAPIPTMSSIRPLLPLLTSLSIALDPFPSSSSTFSQFPQPTSSSKAPPLPLPISSSTVPILTPSSPSSVPLDPLPTISSSVGPVLVPISSPTTLVPLISSSSLTPIPSPPSSTSLPIPIPTTSFAIPNSVPTSSSLIPVPLPTSSILPAALPTSSSNLPVALPTSSTIVPIIQPTSSTIPVALPTSSSILPIALPTSSTIASRLPTSSTTPLPLDSSTSSQPLPVPLLSSTSLSATISAPPVSPAQPSSTGACHGSLWSSFKKIGPGVTELCNSYFSTAGAMSTVSTETLIPPPITVTQVAPSTPVSATVTIVATSTSTDAVNDPRLLAQVTIVTGGVQKRQNEYNPIVWDGQTVMPAQVQSLCSCASITNPDISTYLYLFSTTLPPSTTTVYQSAFAPTTESTVTAPATAVATSCSSDYFQNFNNLDVGWEGAFDVLDATQVVHDKISCCNYCYQQLQGCFAFLWADNPATCEAAIGPGSAKYEQGIPILRPQKCPLGLIQAHGITGGQPAKVAGNQVEYGPCLDTRAYT